MAPNFLDSARHSEMTTVRAAQVHAASTHHPRRKNRTMMHEAMWKVRNKNENLNIDERIATHSILLRSQDVCMVRPAYDSGHSRSGAAQVRTARRVVKRVHVCTAAAQQSGKEESVGQSVGPTSVPGSVRRRPEWKVRASRRSWRLRFETKRQSDVLAGWSRPRGPSTPSPVAGPRTARPLRGGVAISSPPANHHHHRHHISQLNIK